MPTDPDLVEKSLPTQSTSKSYIQITSCHGHVIRKSLVLVEENTVTTIPKLLTGLQNQPWATSTGKTIPQSLPKGTLGRPVKAFRKKYTIDGSAVTAAGHKETLYSKRFTETQQFWAQWSSESRPNKSKRG